MYVGYDPNRIRNRNSGSYEPDITYVDSVPFKPESELHPEIPVLVTRNGTVVVEFQFEPESQLELNYYCKYIYFTHVHAKQGFFNQKREH